MSYVPTKISLGGIWLDKCSFVWPWNYRGVEAVRVVITQASDRYDEFAALIGKGDLTLHLEGKDSDGKQQTRDIKGVQLLEVVRTHHGADGTRVVIADRRVMLERYICPLDINMRYHGVYVVETARSYKEPDNLRDSLIKLVRFPPFAGNLAEGWDGQVGGYDMPDDLHVSGRPMVSAVQRILETWNYDLCVTDEGKFYFSNRIPFAGTASGVLDSIKDEWRLRKRPMAAKAPAGIPKKIYVAFWERHTLQVPFIGGDLRAKKTVTSGGIQVTGIPYERGHGMSLRQVYQAAGTFFQLGDLLRIYGFDRFAMEDSTSTGLEKNVSAHFMNPNWQGTALQFSGKPRGVERERVFTAGYAVRSGHRKFYTIRFTESNGAAWLDMTLGKQLRTGEVTPAHAEGNWTELYNRIVQEQASYVEIPENGRYNYRWVLPLAREHRGVDLITYALDPNNRDDKGELVMTNQREAVVPTAPLVPKWVHREGGVFKLDDDKRRITSDNDAFIGLPIPGTVPVIGYDRKPDPKTEKDNYDIYQQYLAGKNLTLVQSHQDLKLSSEFEFYVYVTATRNFPNDASKFWYEEVEGDPNGDIPVVVLEPDADTFCRRNFIDFAFDITGTIETKTGGEWVLGEGDAQIKDYFGKVMNREEIKLVANRRAHNLLSALKEDTPPGEFEFLDWGKVPANHRLGGSIDSIALDIKNNVVMGTISFGSRLNDRIRREQALMRQARRVAELQGKTVGS